MFQQDISIGEVVTLQDSACFIENYDFCFVYINLQIPFITNVLLQTSSNLQRRVCKTLADSDKSTCHLHTSGTIYVSHSCLVTLGHTGHQSILTNHLGKMKKK